MTEETTQQAQQPNEASQEGAQQASEQNSRFSSDIFFDPRSEVPNEENEFTDIVQETRQYENQEQEQEKANPENKEEANPENQDEIDFDGKPADTASADPAAAKMTKEEMIEALKKEGVEVSQLDPENQNQERADKISHLDQRLSMIDNFLKQPNDIVVKEHLKNEILKQYKSQGRENDIDKEDLQLEIDSKFDDFDNNPAMLKLQADSIRRDVETMRQQVDGEKNTITKEINDERQQVIDSNRTQLKTSLSSFVKNGFMNSPTTAEEVKEVYEEITSGEFDKKLNSSPELVAKFGLFLKKEQQISEALGKPTYGQGVKAAFDQLESKSKNGTSSVANAMAQRSGSGQEVGDIINRFSSNVVEREPETEKKHVAGRGMNY